MKLTRLRISGFKTFVEPTDFLIEPGLTGVIGPNGCGKSNLVEALRWVMGESSYKSMRASGMDDVIFSGSGKRPARNTAEVTVSIDNTDRTAPAGHNDTDTLEVSRRIERADGSTYRINGREVRARDVQLLFADAATGARSPALVRQGQINEIISAKPQSRRRILEDAAGIAGLHARRHEAELRLKGAEDNLLRVEDVLREIESQSESLKKQGRQASRYRTLSAEIRRYEALSLAISFADAREEEDAARLQADEDLKKVAEETEKQTKAATAQAVAAHNLPPLRQKEAETAAAVQRLTHARTELDTEERQSKQKLENLERHIQELEQDITRGATERADAAATILRLKNEKEQLFKEEAESASSHEKAHSLVAQCKEVLAQEEATLTKLQAEVSDLNAQRSSLERSRQDEQLRHDKLVTEQQQLEQKLSEFTAAVSHQAAIDELRNNIAALAENLAAAEQRQEAARQALIIAREAEANLRAPLQEAQNNAQKLETEIRTLAKLLAPAPGMVGTAILEEITTEKGYEIALGAALGDDLDASSDVQAAVHWSIIEGDINAPLPTGVTSLAKYVSAPAALKRRLSQIGVVDSAAALSLQDQLLPGQRLVSKEGGLWRWDGFTAAADAPTPAARRLAEKNRLGDLEKAAATAEAIREKRINEMEAAQAAVKKAAQEESAAIDATRSNRQHLDRSREELARLERLETENSARITSLKAALDRINNDKKEATVRLENANTALAQFEPATELEGKLNQQRIKVAEVRTATSDAQSELHRLLSEAASRTRRSEMISADITSWSQRMERAEEAASTLNERLERARKEQKELQEAPDTYLIRRRALIAEIEKAEIQQKEASDIRAEAENILAETDRQARLALEQLSSAREARAGSQARHEASIRRLAEITHQISETLETSPAGLIELAGLNNQDALPPPEEVERKLTALKVDRERLGAVNLRAEDELTEIEEKKSGILNEKGDLEEAIKRLRQAIYSLNREGRERLLAAFDIVNAHFQNLFTTLFSGGTAELTLVDSDDPLEAGLEILARPPGKKPQTMTLLSGGEQALTAIALIFAVFLTNPSPICVLDEVDAPLDDANVERYCDLLTEMAQKTETRFVVITHNPITMARMDRLFGVTMAEKGVSQLVSVDLEAAEQLVENV
ncbi:chromosome segregation protein SMC [Microvirga sp. W0021]|uniref:Chromosome partition protein Smc n=1 Tax=Hohaiivirga grylli TaxID=3133970 RepID=A0ABV0BHE4_9HYPH